MVRPRSLHRVRRRDARRGDPYPGFHAGRLREPGDFVEGSFSTLTEGFPKGINIIVGKLEETGKTAWQTIRFPKAQWTPADAKEWASEQEGAHGKLILFEEAVEREDRADDARVRRYDRGELLAEPVKRSDGSLLLEGFVCRAGVYDYETGDGTIRRELFPREEAADSEWLKSLARAPVTLHHPVRDGQLVDVDPDNFDEFGVGDVGERVHVDEDAFTRISVAVRRGDAVSAVETKAAVELSPGYDCDIEQTSGVDPEFGPFDAIQRRRRGNHVAIVDRARGGREIRLRADDARAVLPVRRADSQHPQGGSEMNEKLLKALLALGVARADAEKAARVDSLDALVEELEPVTRADASAREMYDELNADFRKASRARDKLQGQFDAMKEKCDGFETELAEMKKGADKKGDAEKLEERIQWSEDRADALSLAAKHDVEITDELKRADNGDIRLAVVRKALPNVPEDATPDYIQGALSGLRGDSEDDASDDESRADGDPPTRVFDTLRQPSDPTTPEQHRDADPHAAQLSNLRQRQQERFGASR